MEVTGILKHVYDTQRVSDRFSKREFVITTEHTTPYPQQVSFQLTQDKCNLLDDLQKFPIGGEVKLQFNLRGREWNGPQGLKFFNTLEAWRIEPIAASASHNPSPVHGGPIASNDNEDLPF